MENKTHGKVSVIIPTHNRPDLVARAVRSVLAQDYRDLELIVVDVGLSVRAKPSLADFFSDTRFHYVENPTELLGGGARNVGAQLAKGEYLAFLDDDDEWFPHKLTTQMEKFHSAPPNVGFCFSAVVNDFGDGKEVTSHVADGVGDFSELAYARMKGFLTVTLIIKKEIFDAVGGFDESLPSHQDPELIIRIAQKWGGLGVNEPLVRVNMHPSNNNGGKNIDKRIRGREMVIAKHFTEFNRRPRVLSRHYFWIGLWYKEKGDFVNAANYFLNAFFTYQNPRYLYHYLRSRCGV